MADSNYTKIGGEDYELREDCQSVWITVGDISVYIKREDEGVAVDLYPLHDEMADSLASCWALNGEVFGSPQKSDAAANELRDRL